MTAKALLISLGLVAAATGFARAEGFALKNDGALFEAAPCQALDLTDELTLEAWVQADQMDSAGGA